MNSRMRAQDRREVVLQAATTAFARGGYAGTSTDTVAKQAGVSQPYVVRIFGTKQDLFLEVFEHACRRIDDAFHAVLAERPFDPDDEEDWGRLGAAYVELLADSDFLHVMMHGFAVGAGVPEIGKVGRAGMARLFETLHGTGASAERVREFLSEGMLLNVLLSMGALNDPSGPLRELVAACLPEDAMERILAGSPEA